jgi:hypothetical protein
MLCISSSGSTKKSRGTTAENLAENDKFRTIVANDPRETCRDSCSYSEVTGKHSPGMLPSVNSSIKPNGCSQEDFR